MANKRAEFTDELKAQIYARDRAICSYSGKSLWTLDYGALPGTADWTDHLRAASAGGGATLANGIAASWIYNKLKLASHRSMPLFIHGRPTADFYTFYHRIPDSIAQHLNRFRRLEASDWYLNRAATWLLEAAASDGRSRRQDGKRFARSAEYWAGAAYRFLAQWRDLAGSHAARGMAVRGLLPKRPQVDQRILMEILHANSTAEVMAIARRLRPYLRTCWRAFAIMAEVENASDAQAFVKALRARPDVPPRLIALTRENFRLLRP